MDKNTRKIMDIKLENTKKALIRNRMKCHILEDEKAVLNYLEKNIAEDSTVNVGGSQTLFESGVIDYLRTMPINFQDRYQEGLSRDEMQAIYREAFTSDYYIASSNAITELGEIYNVDGNGNRVAALIYGPKEIILVIGENKLVANIDEAIARVEHIAAPANNARLEKENPCVTIGNCAHCKLETRICSSYVILRQQVVADRITVLLVKASLGY